jgi:hypothetical protein
LDGGEAKELCGQLLGARHQRLFNPGRTIHPRRSNQVPRAESDPSSIARPLLTGCARGPDTNLKARIHVRASPIHLLDFCERAAGTSLNEPTPML